MLDKKYYSLTYPQNSIWKAESFFADTGMGNIAQTVIFNEDIDCLMLQKALNAVICQNDAMRLRIAEIDAGVRQYISEYREIELAFVDFSCQCGREDARKWCEAQTAVPFDLVDADLFFFTALRFGNGWGGLYIKIHHMITDAWSMSLTTGQILEYYGLLKGGGEIPLRYMPSYTEYILREQEYENSRLFVKDKEFWNKKFDTLPEVIGIKNRNSMYGSIKAGRIESTLSRELTSAIKTFCGGHHVSVNSLFFAALSIYISRITSKTDIVLGSIIHNRSGAQEKSTVGMFISTVPVRMKLDMNMGFESLLRETAKEMTTVLRHQKYPDELLLHDLREKHGNVDRLFDVILSYQNVVFKVDEEWHPNGNTVHALAVHISDRGELGQLKVEIDYQVELFTKEEIEKLLRHLLNILSDGLKNPARPISRLEMVSEEEKQRLLYEFNETHVEYHRGKLIHELFEEQAILTPDKIVLDFNGKQLSYRDLNERSNQLARTLREEGVEPDSIVGIMVERSLEMMIGIMGVLKSGAAYLPLDYEYPTERIEYMLEDSNAALLLSQSHLKGRVRFDKEILFLDSGDLYRGDASNPVKINTSKDLAYVIYTSGSTGQPKGVMIEHRAVCNLIQGVTDEIDFTPDKTILALTTISFDIFVLETLLPLAKGLKVVIADENHQREPELLNALISKSGIDMLQLTPSRMKLLLSAGSPLAFASVKDIMIGGEVFPQALLEELRGLSRARIYNMYGPTETTVWSAIKNFSKDDRISIGRPIANTQMYIIDEYNNLQPEGTTGELCISGDGLARGYLNRPELTAEKFVVNPFPGGGRMYRTGDLARWLPDGEIECLGRMDSQVKIRGFRIELGEIENQLLKNEHVREAAAILKRGSSGDGYICVFASADESLSLTELREHLGRRLPDYMIPSCFVQLEKLPMTPNGKVDKKALQEFDTALPLRTKYVPPGNEVEQTLAEVWREVLGGEEISVNDSFFALGGDSIKAIQIISILKKRRIRLNTKDMFLHPTIGELSEYIKIDNSDPEHEESDCGCGFAGLDADDANEALDVMSRKFNL